MPIDPCYAPSLADPNGVMRPPTGITIDQYRDMVESALLEIDGRTIHAVEMLSIPTADRTISARLYRPSAAACLPVILFYHGGGFVLCSTASHDAMCREIAWLSGAAIVSVDYRRAPETPFPGPLDDCHAALAWVAANAVSLGLDADRIGVCGDSAGGNLAVATALLARDRGPALRHMGLIYPMIDPACTSLSARAITEGPVLSREIIAWFWESYIGNGDPANQLIAVDHANLPGLPSTSVITAEYDPLCDEGEAFAAQLRAAGIETITRRYLGMAHGFFSMPALTPIAGQAMRDLAGDFRAAFVQATGAALA